MLIDMHVHTSVSSPCSWIDPERMVARAKRVGLDAVCVTEHDEIKGAEVAREVGERYGFRVFRGIEIYTEFDDMLVFGMYRDPPGWRVPFQQLLRLVGGGGIIIPAHPCRSTGGLQCRLDDEGVKDMLGSVSALETFNGGCSPEANTIAAGLAAEFGLLGVGGSDAHHEFQIGRCATRFDRDIGGEEDLIEEIRAGRFNAGYGRDLGLDL